MTTTTVEQDLGVLAELRNEASALLACLQVGQQAAGRLQQAGVAGADHVAYQLRATSDPQGGDGALAGLVRGLEALLQAKGDEGGWIYWTCERLGGMTVRETLQELAADSRDEEAVRRQMTAYLAYRASLPPTPPE